jgi:hypothetical protein
MGGERVIIELPHPLYPLSLMNSASPLWVVLFFLGKRKRMGNISKGR